MKRELNKNLRTALIITSIILIGISSLLLYTQWVKPGFKEEKVAVYGYNNVSDADYQVSLKPNDVYGDKTIGEGNHLITTFVDKIDTTFQYNFQGQGSADIKGQYNIMAIVEGHTGEDEEYKILWEKDFPIAAAKSFETKGNGFEIIENVSLKLKEYNDFVRQFIEETEVASQVKLSLVMNVDLEANTSKGMIEETASPSIVIPLNVNAFEITKTGVGEGKGAIEEVQSIPIPPNKNMIILFGIIIAIFVSVFIYLIIFTSGVKADPIEKYTKKLFKNHGSRLVALNNEIAVTCKSSFRVHSIEDLVKIADEIEKPIFYQYKEGLKDIKQFYVLEDTCIYLFDVCDIVEEKEEKLIKNSKKSKKQSETAQQGN